ncbi:hypothetical protein [Rhodococcoides fascians]|uniref:hypothetical protein n=1 Tax=Rhodococcoides fascians TaxID=1828 RepID=UPI00050CD5C2|nr:hypothetical protein [Rhodococcus fascians]
MNHPATTTPNINTDPIEVAARVLAKATLLDSRMPTCDEAVIAAWAEVFDGQGIYLHEALQAVRDFYRGQPRDRLMPGDVIARVKAMPLGSTSSDERIRAWLWASAQYPFSPAIRDATGIDVPRWDDTPTELTKAAEIVDWARTRNIAWVREHLDDLIDAIRAKPPSDRF